MSDVRGDLELPPGGTGGQDHYDNRFFSRACGENKAEDFLGGGGEGSIVLRFQQSFIFFLTAEKNEMTS